MQKRRFQDDILPLKDKLFRLALRITQNRAEAEDIVQETLIKVWDRRDEWFQIKSMEAYCLTLTRNLSIDRSEKAEAQHLSLDNCSLEQPPADSTPQQELEKKEQTGLIARLIDNLPEKQRTILQLREVEEKSYKEIADILCLTEEQVKVCLFRARQHIKAEYMKIEHYGL